MNIESGVEDRRMTFVQFQDALEGSRLREQAGYIAAGVETPAALAALALGRPLIALIAGSTAVGTIVGSLINRKVRTYMVRNYIPQAPTDEDIQRMYGSTDESM